MKNSDENWINLLYLRLSDRERRWILYSDNDVAVKARWMEAIIRANPKDCVDAKETLQHLIDKIKEDRLVYGGLTVENMEKPYLKYEVIYGDKYSVWNDLDSLIGKEVRIGQSIDGKLLAVYPNDKAVKVAVNNAEVVVFLTSGQAIYLLA